jgi:hypothetical protein
VLTRIEVNIGVAAGNARNSLSGGAKKIIPQDEDRHVEQGTFQAAALALEWQNITGSDADELTSLLAPDCGFCVHETGAAPQAHFLSNRSFLVHWGGIFAVTGEMRMLARLVLISLIVLAASFRMPAQGATPTSSKEATAVADTMRAMYVAAATDDLAKFRSLIAPGFYAFDNGKRYDGDALMQMVISAHAKGMKIVSDLSKLDFSVGGRQR